MLRVVLRRFLLLVVLLVVLLVDATFTLLAAGGESLAGGLGHRALSARRLARLGATPDFHHGLPAQNGQPVTANMPFAEARPILDALRDSLPADLKARPPDVLESSWASWVSRPKARKT